MRTRKIYLFAVVTALALTALQCKVNPVTGKRQLNFYSEKREIKMGEENYGSINQMHYGVYDDDQLNTYVSNVGMRLAKGTQKPDYPYEFKVVNSSIINAYCLPGGKIAITRGLLMRLPSEDALAGVLGHEIGHAVAKHTAVRLSYGIVTEAALLGVYAYMGIKGSKYADLFLVGGGITAQLLLLTYSRSQETQSDDLGLEYMTKAGYNPKGMAEVMQVLTDVEKESGGNTPVFLRSHPLSEDRLKNANDQIETKYSSYANIQMKREQFASAIHDLKSDEQAFKYFDDGMDALADENYSKAEQNFRKAISEDNQQALFHAGLAHALMEENHYSKAEEEIEKSVRLNPDSYYAQAIRGRISYEMSEYHQTIERMNRALTLLPDAITPNFYIGASYEKLQDRDEAIKYYKKVYNASPDSDEGKIAKDKLTAWGVLSSEK